MAPIKKTINSPQAPRMPETVPPHIPPGRLPQSGQSGSGGGGITPSPEPVDGSTKKVI